MKKKMIIRILSALAAFELVMTHVSCYVAYAKEAVETEVSSKEEDTETLSLETEVINVKNVEELSEVAANCNNNQWSINKRIELQEDISLEDIDFEPIPIFAGTFNGNGHTISGFHYNGSGYADGFFRYITQTGIIENLTITGVVESENEEECMGGICGVNGGWILNCTFRGKVEGRSETGGIAGENESSGTINNCSVYGKITGYERAGGMAGANYGAIRNCNNKAGINSDSSWLEEKDEAGLEWLLEDVSEKKLVSGTDIGGIAGYSKGIITNCTNVGVVGYEHNGYNVGGIVGRQSGQVSSCSNSGSVFGRKDVGGIVGQMEPYISVEEAESISEAVHRLHDLVDKFLDDASDTQDSVSSDFDVLRTHADTAISNADSIAGQTTEFVDKNVSAVNEVVNRIDYIMERLPYVLNDVNNAIDKMKKAADDLRKLVNALKLIDKGEGDTYDETKYARLSLVSGVGGNVYADKSAPAQGEEVRITITPDEGYKLSFVSAADAGKNTLPLTEADSAHEGSNEYTFVMPEENVVVKAEFAALELSADTESAASFIKYVETDAAEPSVVAGSSEQDMETEPPVKGVETDVPEQTAGAGSPMQDSEAGSPVHDEDADSSVPGASEDSDTPNMTDVSDVKIIVESNAGGKADYSVSGNEVILTVRPNIGYTLSGEPVVTDALGSKISVSKQSGDGYVYKFNIDGAQGQIRVKLTFAPDTNSAAVNNSWSDLSANIDLLQTQMQNISNIMSNINKLMDGKDMDDFTKEDISRLIGYMVELAQELSDAGATLSYILSDLSVIAEIMVPYMEEALNEAGVEMDHLIADLKSVFSYLDSAFGLLRSTILYLNGKFDIQFAKLGDKMNTSVNGLFDELGVISSYVGQINDDLSVHSDILDKDLHAINDQINIIFQLFVQRIEDVEDLYYSESGYEDISDEDIDENSDGKVERSVNNGIVKGDINVGGIAGAMAIDEEDPEGNAAGSVNYSFGSRYLTKCIVDRCKNDGKITAKKDGVGGITGYMNLGIIANSEAYGSAESTEGEYIGGISGESLALIKNCYSLASLKGSSYIGGIAGSGKKIQNCYSMALIDESAIRKGAIAGWIETKEDERLDYGSDIYDNFFVSNKLGGIDEVSYSGIAEALTYEELLQKGVPSQFRHLQLTFISDGNVIERMEVEYGKELSQIEFPDAPRTEGNYGKWPDVTDMTMDSNITLEAEYYDNITTLSSTETVIPAKQDSGEGLNKPYAYIDGIYTDDAVLNVLHEELDAHETKARVGKNADSVIYEITVDGGNLSDGTISKIRIYNPYENVKTVMEKTNANGDWEEIGYKEYGNYIQINMTGNDGIYCIVSNDGSYVWIACIAGGAAAVLLGIIIMRRRARKVSKLHKDT